MGRSDEKNSILGNSPQYLVTGRDILGQTNQIESQIRSPRSGLIAGRDAKNSMFPSLVLKNKHPEDAVNFSPSFTQIFHSQASSGGKQGAHSATRLQQSPPLSINSGNAIYSGSPGCAPGDTLGREIS